MADGSRSAESVGGVVVHREAQVLHHHRRDAMRDGGGGCDPFYVAGAGGGLFDEVRTSGGGGGGAGDAVADAGRGRFLGREDDCRKKRCVDRYDSSESSDSGVAVLSCTDCSGSSTSSSDITDPGSPFSTASSHSEDSASHHPHQPTSKMPPTHQTAWPWTADEAPPINKRSTQEKTAFPKRRKSDEEPQPTSKQSPPCLNASINNNHIISNNNNNRRTPKSEAPSPISKKLSSVNNNNNNKKMDHQKQGKITEYFKSQIKLHVIKKESMKASQNPNKFDQQTQFNGIRPNVGPNRVSSVKKPADSLPRARKIAQVSVPRKILPAPSKIPDNLNIGNQSAHLANFAPTVTLTAVGFPPNLTYIHTKTPKPPDSGIYVPQFATLSADSKLNGIPIINRTPCLNVIHPVHHHHHHPKIATINNFNCVKLNATVVPIVKLNALPPRLSVETALPTVLSAKPKAPVKQHATVVQSQRQRLPDDKEASPSPDSDSGISLREHLEVVTAAEVEAAIPALKSPILSQPKTIRFPAKSGPKDESKDAKSAPSVESGVCRWAECSAQFDTSGALLEHLQVKHVISQASQEQYVCLWLGCKVHGRTSCSRSWLERHVLAHAGTKPFRCIVDGCGQRFNSQTALERHVNGHFTSDGSQNGSTKKSTESSSSKLFKRNGKKIRFRRQPWSARMFDFIDSGIMEGLQHKLLTMTQNGTSSGTIDVMSSITARRVEPNGSVKLLVKWHPAEIIPDEWMLEKDYVESRTVPIPSLRESVKDDLHSRLFQTEGGSRRRRKPISKQT